MSNFGHLKALSVKSGDTADFGFYEIEGVPTLQVAPATSVNRDFFNAVLKASKEASRKMRGRKNQMPTEAQIEEVRRQDVALFVKYIVKGWRNVFNQGGNSVEFSAEECQDFLLAIPSDMFDELRSFCLDISNFRGQEDTMEPDEQEDLSGN